MTSASSLREIAAARTALVLNDYQSGILAALPNATEVLERAAAALDAARAHGVPVVHVRVAFDEQDYASVPARNKGFAPIAAGRRLAEGSAAAEICPEVAPRPGEIVVTKSRFGAFGTTRLAGHLAARGIDTLVLAGISTSGVVLSTVRDGADRDYGLFVLGEACADPDAEVHRVLVERVFPRQADVITIEEFASAIA